MDSPHPPRMADGARGFGREPEGIAEADDGVPARGSLSGTDRRRRSRAHGRDRAIAFGAPWARRLSGARRRHRGPRVDRCRSRATDRCGHPPDSPPGPPDPRQIPRTIGITEMQRRLAAILDEVGEGRPSTIYSSGDYVGVLITPAEYYRLRRVQRRRRAPLAEADPERDHGPRLDCPRRRHRQLIHRDRRP